MRDPRDENADAAQVAPAVDSHGATPKPSPKPALLDRANRSAGQAQKALDVRSAVPIHLKPVLSYAEVAAVGIAPERTLRRLVATGRVKRSVIRLGRRLRFVCDVLIAELLGAER